MSLLTDEIAAWRNYLLRIAPAAVDCVNEVKKEEAKGQRSFWDAAEEEQMDALAEMVDD